MDQVRIGLAQIVVNIDKEENLNAACEQITRASRSGCEIVCLPEMFNTPYNNDFFPEYSETAEGRTVSTLSRMAKDYQIWVIGGSIPERDGEKLYNTAFVFNPQGEIVCKHRKVHLFDVNIPNGIQFMESATLSAGDAITVFDVEGVTIGLGICFDIRFPEQMRLMADLGAEIVFIPAAFNMTTGPAHWHLTARARALDNQLYVALTSPARQEFGYQTYGHSLVADPWGMIVAEAGVEETLLVVDIDLERVRKIRRELPLLKARRGDLYCLNRVDHSAERK